MITVTTPRLTVRRIQPDDWQALKKITRDFAASEYVYYDYAFPSSDRHLQTIAKVFSQTGMFFSVVLQETQEMIGYICLHDDGGSYDIGYCFHSDFHGKGYALESCTALMDAVTREFQIRTFTAGTAIKNTPSVKLLLRLGFQLAYTEPVSFHKDPQGNDIVFEGGRFIRSV